jgi:hypothetical protein
LKRGNGVHVGQQRVELSSFVSFIVESRAKIRIHCINQQTRNWKNLKMFLAMCQYRPQSKNWRKQANLETRNRLTSRMFHFPIVSLFFEIFERKYLIHENGDGTVNLSLFFRPVCQGLLSSISNFDLVKRLEETKRKHLLFYLQLEESVWRTIFRD